MSDEESTTRNQQPRQLEQVLSVSTRRLHSFSPPDLEILVGPNQRIYRYHALILATYSTYIDAILSSPMAAQNQRERRISFPEIPEKTWEAMISYVEPGGLDRLTTVEKVATVLPFYDKYGFTDGLAMCDSWISQILGKHIRDVAANFFPVRFTPIAVMAFDLNLPTAKQAAASWAAMVLTKMLSTNKESTVKMLLPLVENNSKVLKNMILSIKGRHYEDMTIDEMRKMTKEESFPSDIILKTKQIDEMEKILDSLYVKDLLVSAVEEGPHRRITGTYKKSSSRYFNGALRNRGPMRFSYKMNYSEGGVLVIEAMDPFGLKWEISVRQVGEEDRQHNGNHRGCDLRELEDTREGQSTRHVLYRWDCGYSSIFPPQHGWKTVDGTCDIERLSYKFSTSPP